MILCKELILQCRSLKITRRAILYHFQPPRKGFENKDRKFFVKFLTINLYYMKSVLSLQAFCYKLILYDKWRGVRATRSLSVEVPGIWFTLAYISVFFILRSSSYVFFYSITFRLLLNITTVEPRYFEVPSRNGGVSK